MRIHRLGTASVALLAAAALAACSPSVPATVVTGTRVVMGWTGELTSLNALADPTPGNLEVAAATRDGFGERVDGEFVADESFGTVSIVGDDPFVVRYDLAEPSWSDGTPVDAADLLLGWAWAAGLLADADGAVSAGDQTVAEVDEFARSIEVVFGRPTSAWQTAVTAQVPAHVVGGLAFGIEDPMEAKQAVIRAIQERDAARLAAIAEAWNDGFAVDEGSDIAGELLLASGPYRVDGVSWTAEGQSVRLIPNEQYRGAATAQIAAVDLVPAGEDPLSSLGDGLDIVRVTPTAENFAVVHRLERRDTVVETTDDGTVWSVLLRSEGVFAGHAARSAFLRTVPVNDMIDRGAGPWASAYTKTTSMVSAPGSSAYDIVVEDSGFTAALGTAPEDAEAEREVAGVGSGTPVCVLYDRDSPFASGAFAALRDVAAEAGWEVADCGSDDFDGAVGQDQWDAVITAVPVPSTPAQLAAQWGSDGEASLVAQTDTDRDALIAELAQTTDVYTARELYAQIEATIVRAAVARPLAMDPVVTLVAPDVDGVVVRGGATAPLTAGIAQWTAVP
ncbi:MAG: hypothetical protein QM622_10820 [Microbacterium sp.]